MNYSSSSPAPYGVQSQISHHGPGTPIIPSPQDGDINYNLNKIVPSGIQVTN